MISVITMLTRKEGTSHEEFLQHWRERHGPLLARLPSARFVRRYEQHATVWPPEGAAVPEPRYDGVTIQWFDNLAAFDAHLREPDHTDHAEDIARFLDTKRLQWAICETPVVVIE